MFTLGLMLHDRSAVTKVFGRKKEKWNGMNKINRWGHVPDKEQKIVSIVTPSRITRCHSAK